MRIIFASDSYKGSLSSREVNSIEIAEARAAFGEGEYISIEMADGGEGTLSAIERSVPGYNRITETVTDPLGNRITASYLLKGDEAVVEMAEASGLTLIPEELRNPLNTTSYGTGQLIRSAVCEGARTIYIGIGGSATNDGGMGAMKALGFRFLDDEGCELGGYGRDLLNVSAIDDSMAIAELNECTFIVMCDVRNPLTGPNGATYTFGPQKGANGEILEILESGMQRYLGVLESYKGQELGAIEGLGAAGGLGAALYVMLGGRMKSGVDAILDLADFDSLLDGADAVISGEGRTDHQTLNGKVVYGIARRCQRAEVPLHVISGSIGDGVDELYEIGVTSMNPCIKEALTMEEIVSGAEDNLRSAARELFERMGENG